MPVISPITPTGPGRPRTTPARSVGPAISLGEQQYNLGSGLLGNPIAGNGVGQVQMPQGPAMPGSNVMRNSFGGTGGGGGPRLHATDPANPWLRQQGKGIMNQTKQMLGQGLLGIQGQSVGTGGLGGSRQGVAQGTAMGQASNYLSSNLAGMYGDAYESDANRNMQRYGIDTNSFNAQRGQDITMRGQDFQNYNAGMDRGLQQYQGDQTFYGQQRGQDMQGVAMGSGLINQGLNTQWQPMQNAADIYSKFAGNGTTTTGGQSGGGWLGALGGAGAMYQFGAGNGWWGGKT